MTRRTSSMLETHPSDTRTVDRQTLAACIEACFECSQACTMCADACLAEDMVAELRRCLRIDADCADICDATGRVLSRQTDRSLPVSRALVRACQEACAACAEECEQHASSHEHCRLCLEACRICEQACIDLLTAMG